MAKNCKICKQPLPFSERNGLKTYKQKQGIGIVCCLTSDHPEAKKVFQKFVEQNKIKFRKEVKAKDKEQTDILKDKIETKGSLEKKLQTQINLIVRLIDKGHDCISSGRSLGKSYDAGHMFTTNAQPTIRFHLFNIFAQSVHDNQHKSGNELEYFLRLETVFSKDLQDFVLSLKQIPPLHLTKDVLNDKIVIARRIVKWLKLQDKTFTKKERIELRNRFNLELGIYPKEYCEFLNY